MGLAALRARAMGAYAIVARLAAALIAALARPAHVAARASKGSARLVVARLHANIPIVRLAHARKAVGVGVAELAERARRTRAAAAIHVGFVAVQHSIGARQGHRCGQNRRSHDEHPR